MTKEQQKSQIQGFLDELETMLEKAAKMDLPAVEVQLMYYKIKSNWRV